MRKQNRAQCRFYEELNDFLPASKRKTWVDHYFNGRPAIKDLVESLGVPHTAIDLILVNGESVDFFYKVKDGDRISVYPVFESLDITSVTRLRKEPLREPKFILDVHLGKLARYLRLLGFDSLYSNTCSDADIIGMIQTEKRIVLTRDKQLLNRKAVTHGYWIRAVEPKKQVEEVLSRFDLFSKIKPFRICLVCNGKIEKIEKNKIIDRLPLMTKKYFNDFQICRQCKRIFWHGSHYRHMAGLVAAIKTSL